MVISENSNTEHYMLKPIVAAMLKKLGKPNAYIQVCKDERLRGVNQATKWEILRDIINRYRDCGLFLLIIDRDGDEGRRPMLDDREQRVATLLTGKQQFLAECAHQEIEVWILAGHYSKLPKKWIWRQVREHPDPKENYYEPFAKQEGVFDSVEEGRVELAMQAASNYKGIRQRCPEVAELEDRIKNWIDSLSK